MMFNALEKIKTLSLISRSGKFGLMFFLYMVSMLYVAAQADTGKSNIIILNNEYSEYIQSDEGNVHKLIHHVKLLHGSDTLYCDSAFFYQSQNSVEAFGNVAVFQADGTEAFADYMRYTGHNKMLFMRGTESDVQLSDIEGNSLWSKEVYYNLTSKIGTYRKGGTLQNDLTLVNSYTATYDLNSKNARFKGNVIVHDPEYQVFADDLGYNTESKVSTFLSPSVITNEESIMQTSRGTYNSISKIGYFPSRSSILNKANYIEADTLDYDKTTGFGIAKGNVIAIDTVQKSTLYCGHAIYNEIKETLLAFDKPLMKTLDGKDSLFIKADTFYSQPVEIIEDSLTAQDSLQSTADMIHGSIIKDDSVGIFDEGDFDSLALDISEIDSLNAAANLDSLSQDIALPNLFLEDPDTTLLPTLPEFSRIQDSLSIDQDLSQNDTINPESLKPETSLLVYQNKPDSIKSDESDSFTVLHQQAAFDSATAHYKNKPSEEDTNKLRYFTAYPNAVIFSDSLQGKCDSLAFSQQDSLIRMYVDPVLWPNKSQISGDVILIQLENGEFKELEVPRNAIMITRSGPEQAQFYDQIQGNTIKGYFKESNLDSLIAEPNAASIYYITDEEEAYVGTSQATAERIEILFENEEIHSIKYRKDVDQLMTPIPDVNPQEMKLSRFKWREEERPKDLASFLENTSEPQEPQLINLNFGEQADSSEAEIFSENTTEMIPVNEIPSKEKED